MSAPDSHRVTRLVRRLGDGDADVAEELLPLVYDELRGVAHRLFAGRSGGHTLQPTAVVHEAWLKLAGGARGLRSRAHFFAVAARAMRQVLCDAARARRADRRGAGWRHVTLHDQAEVGANGATYDLVDLDDALQRLALANDRHARVVELRCFAGMTFAEIADTLGLTERTIQMDWRAARAFLHHVLGDRP